MRGKSITTLWFGLFFWLTACEEIFEPDITDKKVTLQSPADQAVIRKATVRFSWSTVEGASSYNVVIASPSFAQPTDLYTDTTVVLSAISMPLQPGRYEWRVRASNGGYETAYTSAAFRVDSASSLAGSEVSLKAPANSSFTNKTVMTFSWDPLPQAERYLFEMTGESSFDTLLNATTLQKKLPGMSRQYSWRVTALNATGLATSPAWVFTTDYEAPAAPELLAPRPDTTIFTWPVSLKWKNPAPDAHTDSLYLFAANGDSLVPGFPKVATSGFTLEASMGLAPGTYYWSVKSVDKAANASIQAPKRKFLVR